MAFASNSSATVSAEINVTPLIDVLLVLLIIFMVIVPLSPTGLHTLLPQNRPAVSTEPAEQPPLVLEVAPGRNGAPVYRLGGETVEGSALAARLQGLLFTRPDRTLFIRGEKDLNFASIAVAVAAARSATAERIGLLTPGQRETH